jgi:hypothetical protein
MRSSPSDTDFRHRIHRAGIFAAALGVAMTGAANAADLALTHARIYSSPNAAPIADGTILIHHRVCSRPPHHTGGSNDF